MLWCVPVPSDAVTSLLPSPASPKARTNRRHRRPLELIVPHPSPSTAQGGIGQGPAERADARQARAEARRRRRLATRAAVRVLRRDPGRRRVAGAGEGPGGPVRARARASVGARARAANQGPVGGVERAVAHRVAEAQQPPGGPFGNPVRYGRDGDEAMDAKLYRRREGGRGDKRGHRRRPLRAGDGHRAGFRRDASVEVRRKR